MTLRHSRPSGITPQPAREEVEERDMRLRPAYTLSKIGALCLRMSMVRRTTAAEKPRDKDEWHITGMPRSSLRNSRLAFTHEGGTSGPATHRQESHRHRLQPRHRSGYRSPACARGLRRRYLRPYRRTVEASGR